MENKKGREKEVGDKREQWKLLIGMSFVLAMLFLAKDAGYYIERVEEGAKAVWAREEVEALSKEAKGEGERRPLVVIDAGHGGFDPGKVGIDGVIERDINLAIAKKVQIYLEASDVRVIMTRGTNEGLYDENSKNKKTQDMNRRLEIINKNQPDAVLSIHQNSYTSEKVSGFQVFYHEGNYEGRKLAEFTQESVFNRTGQTKERPIKSNDSYFLLKNTEIPVVIAECGFLSNVIESRKLTGEEYQDRMAYSLHIAVMQFLNKENRGK